MNYKRLIDLLKAEGLDLAEDAAEVVAKSVLKWLEEEVVASENKYDDLLLAIIPALRPVIFKAIDKIDGKDDLPEAVK